MLIISWIKFTTLTTLGDKLVNYLIKIIVGFMVYQKIESMYHWLLFMFAFVLLIMDLD